MGSTSFKLINLCVIEAAAIFCKISWANSRAANR